VKKIALLLVIFAAFTLFSACGKDKAEASPSPTIKPVITTPAATPTPTPTPTPEPKTYIGTVANTDNGVNVRAQPSTDAAILRTADIGETFEVIERGVWCKVKLDDGFGYIHGDYLEITEQD
jgi:uncharacterized protein YgiM (DUF1202 family)